jgi:hypothetical protein
MRGFIVAPETLEDLAQVVPARRRVRTQHHGPLNERESGLQVPALQRDDAEQVQRVRVLRLALQYCAITALRLGQAAGAVVFQREREGLIGTEVRHRRIVA